MAMRNQRKKIWIDRFQTLLFTRIVMYCLLYQAAVWLLFFMWAQAGQAVNALGSETIFSNSLFRGLFIFLALAPILTLDVIKFAHRLVGPLYRFRKTVQAIANDEPVEMVRLRKGDFLMDFRDDFNEMLKLLEQKGYVVIKNNAPADGAPALAATGSASARAES
jgi:hypothetical protein